MMHHPRPQHPFSTREFQYDSYEPHRNQFSFSRSTTSDERSFGSASQTQAHAEASEMMVEPPQYAYLPPSLAHSGANTQQSTQYSPTTYQNAPPQHYGSRLPPQSPTYALRPAQMNDAFSHIEHPPTTSGDQIDLVSSDDENEDRSRAATPHHSRRHMRTTSQRQHSYSYAVAYESEAQGSLSVGTHPQDDRGMSQAADSNPYALNRLPALVEPETPIGTLRPVANHRSRDRGGSESSVGSMTSNAAVVGDAIYPTDTMYDVMNSRSATQASTRFQPHSVPAVYPYEFSNSGGASETQGHASQVHKPGTSHVDSPYIPPSSPQHTGEQTDHPFVYKGADWDYPLRSLRAATVTSTDADAMSLDDRDQDRRSSSRDSNEGSTGRRSKKDKNTIQALDSPAKVNGELKKKTVMACHYCRFRKLRCDGGSPCGHCVKRDKDCTYDVTIRRRGPGRKNKSAQETARVQLAQRQREEADRETRITGSKARADQAQGPAVATIPVEKKDVSMQTSPQAAQYLPTFSQRDRYYTPPSSRHIDSSSSYRIGSPAGHDMGSPPSQHVVSSIARDTSAFSSPAGFQMQFHPPQASPQRPQERQAFAIPFQHEQPTAPEVFPASLAHQQQSQQFTTQHYREHSHEQHAYEPRTPVSTAPSSFYDSPPTQQPVPIQSQQHYQYASSSYNQGQRYGSSQYQGDAHTDTESVYAYSEGANVMPSRYGDQMQVPPPPRSDIQAPYGRGTESLAYPGEDVGRGRVGREWEKTSGNATRR